MSSGPHVAESVHITDKCSTAGTVVELWVYIRSWSFSILCNCGSRKRGTNNSDELFPRNVETRLLSYVSLCVLCQLETATELIEKYFDADRGNVSPDIIDCHIVTTTKVIKGCNVVPYTEVR